VARSSQEFDSTSPSSLVVAGARVMLAAHAQAAAPIQTHAQAQRATRARRGAVAPSAATAQVFTPSRRACLTARHLRGSHTARCVAAIHSRNTAQSLGSWASGVQPPQALRLVALSTFGTAQAPNPCVDMQCRCEYALCLTRGAPCCAGVVRGRLVRRPVSRRKHLQIISPRR
jgi:hypothetical protein